MRHAKKEKSIEEKKVFYHCQVFYSGHAYKTDLIGHIRRANKT